MPGGRSPRCSPTTRRLPTDPSRAPRARQLHLFFTRPRTAWLYGHRTLGRRTALAVLVLSCALLVATGSRGATPGCATAEVRTHDEAVFGHLSTHSRASRL